MTTYRYKLSVVRESAPEPFGTQVSCPADMAALASKLLEDEFQEVSLAFFFDRKHRMTGYIEVGRGGIAHSPMEAREILVAAFAVNAAAVAVAHNHPSGDPSPSPDDAAVTRRLMRACALVGLEFLDHLVIGANGAFFSLSALAANRVFG